MGGYYHTEESVQEYIQLAKDVNGKALIEQLKLHLPSGSTLLELGSGPGTDWKILSKEYNVTGSDYSSEFLSHLKKAHPDGEFLPMDASNIKSTSYFHGIYSNKVLHHLTNEQLQASIRTQSEVLHSNGIVCHSFWKGEGSEEFKGMFVNYHNSEALQGYFEQYFEVISIEPYAEFENNDSLLLIGRKK